MRNNMTDEERYKAINDLLEQLKQALIVYGQLDEIDEKLKHVTSQDFPKDYSYECEMCGKPMEYRYCGMCTHCEMVYNG